MSDLNGHATARVGTEQAPGSGAHGVRITAIHCFGTSDFAGTNDEVYVLYQADAGPALLYPAKQNMNSTADPSKDTVSVWYVDIELWFDHEVLVTLWDKDPGTALTRQGTSEFLINCQYTPSNVPTSWNMVNHNGANYTLNAERIQ